MLSSRARWNASETAQTIGSTTMISTMSAVGDSSRPPTRPAGRPLSPGWEVGRVAGLGAVPGRPLALGRDGDPLHVVVGHHELAELRRLVLRRRGRRRPGHDLAEAGGPAAVRAPDRGDHAAVLGQEARHLLALGAAGQRVL